MKIVKNNIIYEKIKDDLTIVHLSDIHISSKTSKKLLDEIISLIKPLNPNYIMITGDLYNSSDSNLDAEVINDFLSSLGSIAPVYVCCGNSELKGNVLAHENSSNCTYMFDDGVSYVYNNDMFIYALNFDRDFYYKRGCHNIDYLMDKYSHLPIDRDKFNILLCHDPLILDMDFLKNFDLILFGHTHGKWVSKINRYLLSLFPFYDSSYSYEKRHNGFHNDSINYNTTRGVTNFHSDFGRLSLLEVFNTHKTIDVLTLVRRK